MRGRGCRRVPPRRRRRVLRRHTSPPRRKGKLGGGDWALPGGHLEFGESFEECASREVLEETGIRLERAPTFAYAINTVFPDSAAHYVTIFMRADVPVDTTPQLLEPEKCEGWEWCAADAVPRPTFLPLAKLLDGGFRLD